MVLIMNKGRTMRTVSKPDAYYGCNTNHPDFKPRKDGYYIQDGWVQDCLPIITSPNGIRVVNRDRNGNLVREGEHVIVKLPVLKWVPDRMSKGCDYDRWNCDPYCKGCNRANGENI